MISMLTKELPSGHVLATLLIEIRCNQHMEQHVVSKIAADRSAACHWLKKESLRWMLTRITNYVNQRERAYGSVGALTSGLFHAIQMIRLYVLTCTTYDSVCSRIVMQQDHLRLIFPHAASSQHAWVAVITEIIQYAHDHNHIQQQQNRQVPGHTAAPAA